MKFCRDCGNQVSLKDKFCTKCGVPIATSIGKRKTGMNDQNESLKSEDATGSTPSKRRTKPKPKRKIPKWVYWTGTVVILVISAITFLNGNNRDDEVAKVSTIEQQDEDILKDEQAGDNEKSDSITETDKVPNISPKQEEKQGDTSQKEYTQETAARSEEAQSNLPDPKDVQEPASSVDTEKTDTIEAPFAMGTPRSELIAYYGEPDYDDYFTGSRYVMFGKEGYFIDELNDTVRGYFFGNSNLNIFGATVGMTGEEINRIYEEDNGPYYDESETQSYLYGYSKNGFKILLYSDVRDGPTTSVAVVEY